MRWSWIPLLLAAVASAERDWTTPAIEPFDRNAGLASTVLQLPAIVARALNRIRESPRDYRLMDDLWFEKLPETEGFDGLNPAFKSPPKNVVELANAVFDTHRLSWRNAIVQGMDFNVYKDRAQKYRIDISRRNENDEGDSQILDTRTFGVQRRRMQLIMLPVMYKLGVITTLLTGLTVLSLKGVTIGIILLILAVAGVVTKVSKHQQYAPYAAAPSPWSVHDPYDRSSQPQHFQQAQDKNIHVHVHTSPGVQVMSSPGVAMRNPPSYGDGTVPAGDAIPGTSYWNRGNEDYYDAAVDHYYSRNGHTRLGGSNGAESSTSNSVYNRWLG